MHAGRHEGRRGVCVQSVLAVREGGHTWRHARRCTCMRSMPLRAELASCVWCRQRGLCMFTRHVQAGTWEGRAVSGLARRSAGLSMHACMHAEGTCRLCTAVLPHPACTADPRRGAAPGPLPAPLQSLSHSGRMLIHPSIHPCMRRPVVAAAQSGGIRISAEQSLFCVAPRAAGTWRRCAGPTTA